MTGQKINWWDSDIKSTPPSFSNVDIYCNLRWNDSAQKKIAGINSYASKGTMNGGIVPQPGMAPAQTSDPTPAPQINNTYAVEDQIKEDKNEGKSKGRKTAAERRREKDPAYQEQKAVIAQQKSVIEQQQQTIQSMQQQGNNTMSAPVPNGVQSTPVIQPFVVVPYSTPMQPIYHYNNGTLPIGDIDSDYMKANGMLPQNPMGGPMFQNPLTMGATQGQVPGVYDDMFFTMDQNTSKDKKDKKRKSIRVSSIFMMVFILIFAVVPLFINSIVDLLKLSMASSFGAGVSGKTMTLYGSFRMLIDLISGKTAFAVGSAEIWADLFLVLSTVMLFLVLVVAIITITNKKMPLVGIIFALAALVFVFVALICVLADANLTPGLSAYVMIGLALLVCLFSLIGGRSDKKKKGRGKK